MKVSKEQILLFLEKNERITDELIRIINEHEEIEEGILNEEYIAQIAYENPSVLFKYMDLLGICISVYTDNGKFTFKVEKTSDVNRVDVEREALLSGFSFYELWEKDKNSAKVS